MLTITESVGPFSLTETATGDRDVNKLLIALAVILALAAATYALIKLSR
jgi:hypothetical protein